MMSWVDQLRSADWAEACRIALGAYALGCFTVGYYLVKWRTGRDLRGLGSGSVGAKNAARALGWTGFLITLAGDFTKGGLAVWTAGHFTQDVTLLAVAVLGVVAGHIWPFQLRFHGGKGIATSLGALLLYDAPLLAACAILFSGAFVFLRRTVLPGLFAFACLPFVSAYLGHSPSKVLMISLLAGLVIVAHRKNLVEECLRLGGRDEIQPKHSEPKL